MRIITWNCNMAFRKKAGLLLAYQPDILVVPECECIEKLVFAAGIQAPSDVLWFGNNKHKGLAVLAYNGLKLGMIGRHNTKLQTIAPIAVTGGTFDFTLFAIWANNPNDPDGQYVEQVWKAIHHYKKLLKPERTVLAGDFNSNTIWDRPRRLGNHSAVVRFLKKRNIESVYHLHQMQEHGKEQHPTFYLYRHKEKSYHLDYCFVSADLAARLHAVEVGEHTFWSKYSDHMPVIVSFFD